MNAMVDVQHAAHLEIRDVTRRFDAVGVLESINLTVAEGEFLALLGPSGCGKTTLLRCIAGLLDRPRAMFSLMVIRSCAFRCTGAASAWFFKATHYSRI